MRYPCSGTAVPCRRIDGIRSSGTAVLPHKNIQYTVNHKYWLIFLTAISGGRFTRLLFWLNITVIRLRCFYDTVDDLAGFHAVDTVISFHACLCRQKLRSVPSVALLSSETSPSSRNTFNSFSWLMQ